MDNTYFRGSGLIITDKQEENCHNDVVVVTQYASSLSKLIFELKKLYADRIEYLNKYDFYPTLGKAANEYLSRGDNQEELLNAVRTAAAKFWE